MSGVRGRPGHGLPRWGAGATHPLEHGGLLALQDRLQDSHQPQRVPPVRALQGARPWVLAGQDARPAAPSPSRSGVSGPQANTTGAEPVSVVSWPATWKRLWLALFCDITNFQLYNFKNLKI